MEKLDYRVRAVLARVRSTLDRFSLRLEVDWNYDVRKVLEEILALAVGELEFGDGAPVDRALLITQDLRGDRLEAGAGWSAQEEDLTFSRTIVDQTMQGETSILCEDALDDPRFRSSDSLRGLQVLTLLSVPLRAGEEVIGALYIERRDARHLFNERDQSFVEALAETIAPSVRTALIHQNHVRELRNLRSKNESTSRMGRIIGQSTAITRTLDLARTAAKLDRTVLITGESGVGKELLARAIHDQSKRSEKPFSVVDCSGLSETLLESELFGHMKGSFTGANEDKIGAFEAAEGGTVFLDEISDATGPMQQLLRRVLQEGEIRRVGDRQWRKVDVRVLCATNRDLAAEVEKGNFLLDLFHRMHEFPVRLPPLRERKEDIPLLTQYFVALFGENKNPPIGEVTPDALAILTRRDWTGNNIRELRNVIRLCVDLAPGPVIDTAVLGRVFEVRGDPSSETPILPELQVAPGSLLQIDQAALSQLIGSTPEDAPKEKRPWALLQREFGGTLITETLRQTRWKLRPAARILGISPVKLRQDFRLWIEHLLDDSQQDHQKVATRLGMPIEMLIRKLGDLGIGTAPPADQGPS
ncbi:MAG TPA: sigma-54-dependent Fis family transcriptional regulator [Planctomycetes bacterium]|nr:sigma-54-dependent Fis family transcriptional regulator [Planctomycetota bacterium]HIK82690.1 sigma-54-dependent Fis family transcriptional regulator [Planctomycetota bacterium]